MKKMAIVPFKMLEEMNRWKTEQRPRLPPSPQVAQTADLQNEMGSVLQREDLSESEKAQLFGQTLQKFQLAHKKAVHPQPTQPSLPSLPIEKKKPLGIHDRIVDSVPTSMRRKAKLLLQMLEEHPQMSWNDQGVLEYNGKPIPGSNVIDLVNDVIRNRKGSNPRGWEQFSRGLKQVNVPQEYVGNRQRWSWMQRHDENEEDSDEEPDEQGFFETSSYLPPTPKKAIKQSPKPSTSQNWEAY